MKHNIKRIAYGISATGLSLLAGVPVHGQTEGEGFVTPEVGGMPQGSVSGIIVSAMNWLLGIVGVIAVIAFAIAGILYLTAAGDEKQIEKAKRAMIMSIVGVLVSLLGLVVINAVKGLLSESSSF